MKALKTDFGLWALFAFVLYLPGWFIPFLHEFPDSPGVSPAGALFMPYGPCIAGYAVLAVLRFAFFTLPAAVAVGWFVQRAFQTIRYNHAIKTDAVRCSEPRRASRNSSQ